MIQETINYEERLTTIANTRLIYNTMDELENMLDNNSIHSNGIKRSFPTEQKLRSAYRDLKGEVDLMTSGILNLDIIMHQYHKAWIFFHNNLHRRANPEQVALELLSFCHPPFHRTGISPKRVAIYQQVIEQEINIPFLLLMLMKAIPGYDSKDGDADNMPLMFDRTLTLLQTFADKASGISILPSITRAREETNKSRLMLLFHVSQILDKYKSYADNISIYETASNVKASHVNLDIAGFWNEYEGTDFWQIENTTNHGIYFMTHWHKDAGNQLTGIRYTLFIIEGADGTLIYYMLHPEAIKHRMKGLQYGDADQVWYTTDWLDEKPDELPLHRHSCSNIWQPEIHLTRCSDDKVISLYERWLNNECEIVKPYQHFEYTFHPTLYAVTLTHLYIPSENEGEYYKVPKSACEGFELIQLGDNVGTMQMNSKTYLAFDEFLLYIGTTKKELLKYNIERVNCIE